MECGVGAEAIPRSPRQQGTTWQEPPPGQAQLPGVQGRNSEDTNKHTPCQEALRPKPFLVWFECISIGIVPARTLPGKTFYSEPLLIFCCCFPSKKKKKKKVKWAGLLPGLSAWEGSMNRDSSCLENGAESGVHWGVGGAGVTHSLQWTLRLKYAWGINEVAERKWKC